MCSLDTVRTSEKMWKKIWNSPGNLFCLSSPLQPSHSHAHPREVNNPWGGASSRTIYQGFKWKERSKKKHISYTFLLSQHNFSWALPSCDVSECSLHTIHLPPSITSHLTSQYYTIISYYEHHLRNNHGESKESNILLPCPFLSLNLSHHSTSM